MANIILSMFSEPYHNGAWQISGYYQAMANELVCQGNNVLLINTHQFLKKAWNGDNSLLDNIDTTKLKAKIIDFNPDLVIAFGNTAFKDLHQWVECPFAVWDSDTFPYFCDKETIKQKPERFTYFALCESSFKDYQAELPSFANIHLVKSATGIQSNMNAEKEHNIGFIGGCYKLSTNLKRYIEDNRVEFVDILNQVPNVREIYKSLPTNRVQEYELNPGMLIGLMASTDRKLLISLLAPLGMKLFGDYQWLSDIDGFINILKVFDERLIYNLEQLDRFYNSVKVGISLSHPQNISGYPWRVLDILASSACLVSDKKPDLINEFGKRVELPMYENPAEAYMLSKQLINDESRRLEIVESCNEIIQSEYTWEHRFKQIGEICNVSLIGHSAIGSQEILNDGLFIHHGSSRIIKSALLGSVKKMPKKPVQLLLQLNKKVKLSKLLPDSVAISLYNIVLNKLNQSSQTKSDRPLY